MHPFSNLFPHVVLLLLACIQKNSRAQTYIDLTQEWELGPLYEKNEASCIFRNRFKYTRGITGYVIIKDGRIAAEGYRDEEGEKGKTPIYSVTKSWSTMLLGYLVDKGLLSVNATLGDVFNETKDWMEINQAEEKKQITIFELLTMTSGLSDTYDMQQQNYTLANILNSSSYDENMVGKFEYLGSSHIISRIIHRISGLTPKEVAIESGVFRAMGIEESDYEWATYDGIEGSSIGLSMSPRTLAKLGMLYLQNGYAADGTSVISSDWVTDSIKSYVEADYGFVASYYGYQWYTKLYGRDGSFGGRGFFGNNLFCFPDLNVVIAITSEQNIFSAYYFEHVVMWYIEQIESENESCFGSLILGACFDWLTWLWFTVIPFFFSSSSYVDLAWQIILYQITDLFQNIIDSIFSFFGFKYN